MKCISLKNARLVNKCTVSELLKASYKNSCFKGDFLHVEMVTSVVPREKSVAPFS